MNRLRFASHLAPALEPTYRAIARAVGDRLGIATDFVVAEDYSRCERDLDEVCFVCSLPYVELHGEGRSPGVPVAAPVVKGERYAGRPIYFSDVVVRADSDIRRFSDLRGRSWAYNEPRSHSGYGVVRHRMVTLGETSGFFGRVVEAGFHEEALRMVAAGDVDAAAIDSHLLDVLRRRRPDLEARIRVIDVLGPSTIQPVVVSKRVRAPLRDAVREALLRLRDDPAAAAALDDGSIDRFVAVDDGDYDDVREMRRAALEAGYPTLR